MGDQLTGSADRISIAGFADRDTGNHVADVFEIDLGLKHADHIAGEAFNRHGDGHVGFRAAHEIRLAEKRFTAFGGLKSAGAGSFLFRVGQYGTQTRGLDLDGAVTVERHSFGDRRRDQQEFFQFKAELVGQSLGCDLAAARLLLGGDALGGERFLACDARCLDLPWTAVGDGIGKVRLQVSADGRSLALRQPGVGTLATIDLVSLTVRSVQPPAG